MQNENWEIKANDIQNSFHHTVSTIHEKKKNNNFLVFAVIHKAPTVVPLLKMTQYTLDYLTCRLPCVSGPSPLH